MNSLRVVMQPAGSEDERNWALTEAVPDAEPEIGIQECELKAPWEEQGLSLIHIYNRPCPY